MSNEAEGQEKVAGTNLTTVPEYAQTALVLNDLKQRFAGRVFESLETDAQRKAARKDIAEVRDYRTGLEAERKRIKAPALERCRLIDAEAARLTTELRALEDPMKAQLDAKEAEIEAEKIRKANAEAERLKGHMDAIQRMRDFPLSLQGKPASVIDARIEDFREVSIYGPEGEMDFSRFEEFSDQAKDAYLAAFASSKELLHRQRDHEAEQEQIRRDREELAKQRAENERLQREADERREADARREREAQEAAALVEQKRVSSIREKIKRIKDFTYAIGALSCEEIEARKEMLADLEPSNAGFDEFFMEAAEVWGSSAAALEHALIDRRNADAEEAAKREAAAQRQRELDEATERHRQEQARLDRERAEHEAKVEADRLANLGLLDAVKAVVDFYSVRENYPQCIVDLIHVYGNQHPGKDGHTDKRNAAKPVRKPRAQV